MASLIDSIKKRHIVYLCFGIICSVVSIDSFSISETKPLPNSNADKPAEIPNQVIRLDLPVHYQITKTRIFGNQANTETENYRETWTLEVHQG